ncbi:MAG: YncE family protein [Thermoplasmata archaeon]|nr:YncE family protein [Thermoplasmata archaeon]
MPLTEVSRLRLPPHPDDGGFDHAAIHRSGSRLYVAHPSNDGVDVIDLSARRFVHSLSSLKGVAGVWVSEEGGLLFTTNRREDTVSVFRLPDETELYRLPTGSRPNGIAFDARRQTLLVAGVGHPDIGAPPLATVIDASTGRRLHQFPFPGRSRWATFHAATDSFYVNIADPPHIAVIDGGTPSEVRRLIDVPGRGPHGLDQDPDGKTLYCACDDGQMVQVDVDSGIVRAVGALAGAPDVVWLNARLGRLYVAIGEPGVVQVFRTNPWALLESVPTAEGAHTLTVDPRSDEVHVFLPHSHEDLVLRDS